MVHVDVDFTIRRDRMSESVQPAMQLHVMLQVMLRIESDTDNAATLVRVEKEMVKPLVEKSARISNPGTVDKIMSSIGIERPESADRSPSGDSDRNTLRNAEGDAVSLKVASKVELTVEANSQARAKE